MPSLTSLVTVYLPDSSVQLGVGCWLCIGVIASLHQQVFRSLQEEQTIRKFSETPVELERVNATGTPVNVSAMTRDAKQLHTDRLPAVPPRRRKQLPPIPLHVPLPIFVLSLPKSGTTSTHKYFECGRHKSVHWGIKNDTKHVTTLGQCWGNNYRNGRPMLDGCGSQWNMFSDVGYVYANDKYARNNTRDGHLNCFYPSVHGLDNIANFYPNATIMLVTRNATAWADRIQHWAGLHRRWQAACPGFPKGHGPKNDSTLEEWVDFYQEHTASIRNFVADNPGLTYVEVALEAEETGAILEERVGISKYCWGDCPPTLMSKCNAMLKQLQAEGEGSSTPEATMT